MRTSTCWKSAEVCEGWCCAVHDKLATRITHSVIVRADLDHASTNSFIASNEGRAPLLPARCEVLIKPIIVAAPGPASRSGSAAACEATRAGSPLPFPCHAAWRRGGQD